MNIKWNPLFILNGIILIHAFFMTIFILYNEWFCPNGQFNFANKIMSQKTMQVWYFSRCEILSGKVFQTERLKTNQDNVNMIKHQHLKVRLILTATKYVWEWSDTFCWNGLDFLLVFFASYLWCIYDLYHIIDVLLDLSLLFQSGIKWTHGGSNNTNPCFSSFSTSSPSFVKTRQL